MGIASHISTSFLKESPIHNYGLYNDIKIVNKFSYTADCSPDTFFDWTWSQNRNIPQYDELPYHNNPELLFMMNPKAKMIVSIRNPTYR